MRWVRLVIFLALVSAAVTALSRPIGVVPPLGIFINPFGGFWQNGTSLDEIPAEVALDGLQDEVEVLWDDRRVPHIFAANTHDLYLTQGYLTARDRLWQLDFQTLVAAGRLSEILGDRTVRYDQFHRRIGMAYAAERSLELMRKDPETVEALEAYSAGVNAWIDGLGAKELPIEYKLLDYAPERYTPEKTALLIEYFSQMLTFTTSDYPMTRSLHEFGPEVCSRVYPATQYFLEPIIPVGTPWEFEPLVPTPPATRTNPDSKTAQPETDLSPGSNNWAVSGEKTKTGSPLLCFDPHLQLSLPGIWYEAHLVAPGINVYGFTAPGAPGVVFGFNSYMAWGGTNAEGDLTDWYDIEFRDASRREYRHGGKWLPVKTRVEEILVRNGPTVRDTVVYTHHGPIPYAEDERPFYPSMPPGRAMRWIGNEPSNEVGVFLRINRATNHDEFREAIYGLGNLLLNVNYADVEGNIAIWQMGAFPLRWQGQGTTIMDGSEPMNDWQGWIPKEHLPHVKNPARGFVSSANQVPTDESYPYYLPGRYLSPERAGRINEVLSQLDEATPQDMMDLQMDRLNPLARDFLPVLLPLIDPDSLSSDETLSFDELEKWDYRHNPDVVATVIFAKWWWWLYVKTWADDIERKNYRLEWPSRDVMKHLILNEQGNLFFDDKSTARVETLADIALASFKKAHEDLTEEYGPLGPHWAVGSSRGTDIDHMAGIPGLGLESLRTGGDNSTVNATTLHHGPTFRMTVSLEPRVRAWGHNSSGQTGNPGSAYYDKFVDDWLSGNMPEFVYPASPEEAQDRIIATTVLRGAK